MNSALHTHTHTHKNEWMTPNFNHLFEVTDDSDRHTPNTSHTLKSSLD